MQSCTKKKHSSKIRNIFMIAHTNIKNSNKYLCEMSIVFNEDFLF